MKLGTLLEGCRHDTLQSVGIMQMIPLLNPRSDESRFASPDEAVVNTSDYGSVGIRNPTGRVMIVPLHAAYMSKKNAQDHATTSAGVVKPEASVTFSNSLCIESTQGGLYDEDQYRLSILPASLRADVAPLQTRHTAYNGSWSFIERYNTEMGSGRRAHLRDFFERFEKELDEFISQFEPVPCQVGAIILIGGEIVGIERAPSQACWLGVWEALIRDCYGSRCMQATKRLEAKNITVPESRARLEGSITSLDALERALLTAECAEEQAVQRLVDGISEDELNVESPYERLVHGSLDVKVVSNTRMTGQVVVEGPNVVYASAVAAGVAP
jgi:hypothetical protein